MGVGVGLEVGVGVPPPCEGVGVGCWEEVEGVGVGSGFFLGHPVSDRIIASVKIAKISLVHVFFMIFLLCMCIFCRLLLNNPLTQRYCSTPLLICQYTTSRPAQCFHKMHTLFVHILCTLTIEKCFFSALGRLRFFGIRKRRKRGCEKTRCFSQPLKHVGRDFGHRTRSLAGYLPCFVFRFSVAAERRRLAAALPQSCGKGQKQSGVRKTQNELFHTPLLYRRFTVPLLPWYRTPKYRRVSCR